MKFGSSKAVLLLFSISSIVVLAVSIFAGRMMSQSASMIEESSKKQMVALSHAASLLVTGEELDRFMVPEDMEKEAYKDLKRQLIEFNDAAGITFTYYMRLDTDTNMMQFIIDNDEEEPVGLDTEQAEREYGVDRALEGEYYPVPLGSYSEGYENLLTAWAPVLYSDGSPSLMVAGVDMVDTFINRARRNLKMLSVVLVVAIASVILSAVLTLRLYVNKARQSEVASVAKSSFLSRMSHEMRTPMNAIIGFCRMAQEEGDSAAVGEYISNIGVAAQHLRRVIDDVLDISKIESGKMELEYIPVALRSELQGLQSIIAPQAAAKGLDFVVEVTDGVPEYLRLDPTHVRQILVNMLSNAVKFTSEGGRIGLSICSRVERGGTCEVEWRVSDNGIGMDAGTISKLFKAFEQGDVSVTRKFGGTGLGLAISKQLAEMMGGSIRVESVPGEGSDFILTIPLAVASEEDVANDETEDLSEAPDLSGKNLLLVEDSEINQMIAIDIFEKYGATVDTASNGKEGLEKYLKSPEKYEIIFMDVQMPIMDGYSCTKAIRASGASTASSIPIIAMTANVFKEDVEAAREAGMSGHVGKPFEAVEIERAIRKVLA